jgi:hypothetical protein
MQKALLQSPPKPGRAVESRLDEALRRSRPRPELLQFRNNLLQAMERKGLTASALARDLFGTTKDKRGYLVARNRDRITHYLAGTSYPEPANPIQMAKILGIDVQSLAIQQPGVRMPRLAGKGSRRVSFVDGHAAIVGDSKADVVLSLRRDGTAILELRPQRMTRETALKIIAMLNEEPQISEEDTTRE